MAAWGQLHYKDETVWDRPHCGRYSTRWRVCSQSQCLTLLPQNPGAWPQITQWVLCQVVGVGGFVFSVSKSNVPTKLVGTLSFFFNFYQNQSWPRCSFPFYLSILFFWTSWIAKTSPMTLDGSYDSWHMHLVLTLKGCVTKSILNARWSQGWWDDSVDQSACYQTWQREFSPGSHVVKRTNSCKMSSNLLMYILQRARSYTHTCIHTKKLQN